MFVDTWHEAGVEGSIEAYVAKFTWFDRKRDHVQRAIKLAADRLVHEFGGIDSYRKLPSKLRLRIEELLAYILVNKLTPDHSGPPIMTAVLITYFRLREEAAELGLGEVPELEHWLAI
jgi:hypothetical protein